jgi:hypothetical protein
MKCGASVSIEWVLLALKLITGPFFQELLLCTMSVRDHATALAVVVEPPENANPNTTLAARHGACLKIIRP